MEKGVIQQAVNGMITLLFAKFMLNDVPHAFYSRYEEPPTPAQIRYITNLCIRLGISEPLEEQVHTKGEAGRLIRELAARGRGVKR